MGMTIDISKYYSSLTPKFTPSYTIKTSSPFINMTLQPAGKLKYNSRNNKCEVLEDGNDD
jgi:hypothetical protein